MCIPIEDAPLAVSSLPLAKVRVAGEGPETFKGVDIRRAVRSFDPCLPCGVHMYTGAGRVRKVPHRPTGLS